MCPPIAQRPAYGNAAPAQTAPSPGARTVFSSATNVRDAAKPHLWRKLPVHPPQTGCAFVQQAASPKVESVSGTHYVHRGGASESEGVRQKMYAAGHVSVAPSPTWHQML